MIDGRSGYGAPLGTFREVICPTCNDVIPEDEGVRCEGDGHNHCEALMHRGCAVIVDHLPTCPKHFNAAKDFHEAEIVAQLAERIMRKKIIAEIVRSDHFMVGERSTLLLSQPQCPNCFEPDCCTGPKCAGFVGRGSA